MERQGDNKHGGLYGRVKMSVTAANITVLILGALLLLFILVGVITSP